MRLIRTTLLLIPILLSSSTYAYPYHYHKLDRVYELVKTKASPIISDDLYQTDDIHAITNNLSALDSALSRLDNALQAQDRTAAFAAKPAILSGYQTTLESIKNARKKDIASERKITYYDDSFSGKTTSLGDIFSQDAYSAAQCDIPLGSLVEIESAGGTVTVKVNDRPNCKRYPKLIDLSRVAYEQVSPDGKISTGSYRILGTAPKNYTKKLLPKDTFSEFGVLLDAPIANTYIVGESININGTLTTADRAAIVGMITPDGTHHTLGKALADNHFSYTYPLDSIGTYYFVVASGDTIISSHLTPIYVLPKSVFTRKSSLVGTNDINISWTNTRDELSSNLQAINIIQFSKSGYYIVIFSQGDSTFAASGLDTVGFSPKRLDIFDASKEVSIRILRREVSSRFSLDAKKREDIVYDGSLFITPGFAKEIKDGIDARMEADGIHIYGSVIRSGYVSKNVFVTLPDGSVEEYTLDVATASDGSINANTPINMVIPTHTNGTYRVEVNDIFGIAALNTQLNTPDTIDLGSNLYDQIDDKTVQDISQNDMMTRSLEKINAMRKAAGLNTLRLDADISRLAQSKSEDMAQNKYVGHTDSLGNKISTRAKKMGITGFEKNIGENVAGGNVNFEALFAGLALSGGHRKNMLGTEWKSIGFGLVETDGVVYYTQIFSDK